MVGGAIAGVAGVILTLVGVSDQKYAAASPVPLLAGASLLGLGVLLLLCSFVLSGVDSYLRHPRDGADIADRSGSTP